MKKTKKLQTVYTYAIAVLAVVSVIIAIADMSTHIPYWLSLTDEVIYLVFVVDYITRFFLSKKKIILFHWCDEIIFSFYIFAKKIYV